MKAPWELVIAINSKPLAINSLMAVRYRAAEDSGAGG